MEEHGRICCILLPQLLMIAMFDVQGWCSLLFVVCMLIGMELSGRNAASEKTAYDQTDGKEKHLNR